MENREEVEEEVTTKQEIVDYILAWKQKPYDAVLKPNQITAKKFSELSGRGIDWCKDTLKEMCEAELCARERCITPLGGWYYVYTFPEELPDFSS